MIAAMSLSVISPAVATAGASPVFTLAGVGPIGTDFPFGGFSGDRAAATSARLDKPTDVLVLRGRVLIADSANDRIRRVDRRGRIETVAGNGHAGAVGDGGPARSAQLNAPLALAPDGSGGFLIADSENNRVRRVSHGTISTIAGTGVPGFAGDGGAATTAQLDHPSGIARAPDGSVLIADAGNERIRRIETDGTIETVAGSGAFGFGGDGGPATAARLAGPSGVAATSDGSVLIADSENDRVRKVDARGTITTIAGTGSRGFAGDGGPAKRARLARPLAVAPRGPNAVLIADSLNNRVRIAERGTIRTLVGGGRFPAYSGDGGSATRARLRIPNAVTPGFGGLLVADTDNNVVRVISGTRMRLLVAVRRRSIRTHAERPARLAIRSSRTAKLSVRLIIDGAVESRVTRSIRPGLARVSLPSQRRGVDGVVRVIARTEDGAVATDRARVRWR